MRKNMRFVKNKRVCFDFLRTRFFLTNDGTNKCTETYFKPYNFSYGKTYCTPHPIILRNSALARYVDEFRKDFEAHQGGKFRGMKRNVAQRKVEIVNSLMSEWSSAYDNINSLQELHSDNVKDEAFLKSLDKELEQQKQIMENAEDAMLTELIPEDENESCNEVIVEVTAGVGGQEAMLFAQNLYELYCSYVEFKKWNCELTDLERTDLGGVRHSSLLVSGPECYKFFRLEGGVHRVQRIPKTEKNSRMHTSTATVAILPQPSEIDIVIDDKDLKIETKTARGPGGQHVNKIETAVRIHHIPTGIIVDCQVHKSQYQNKKIAMQKLRSKLYSIELEKTGCEVRNLRKCQIGTKSRNEKVRTYNFSQGRITDHRFNLSVYNLERYFEGNDYFDDFLHSLLEIHAKQNKKEFLDMLKSAYA
ncbi:peptide chain release factor 1-like, mitochondrial [Planococcus citri]|uniref:peptide chain release factor 1-like, mitochondrial n=1 Tax=Planococcus citri TaxID=170843 RepID=UPI0031F9AD06